MPVAFEGIPNENRGGANAVLARFNAERSVLRFMSVISRDLGDVRPPYMINFELHELNDDD